MTYAAGPDSEELVGEALHILRTQHNVMREDLFIQTKSVRPSTSVHIDIRENVTGFHCICRFTPMAGQDQTGPLPYDPSTRLETQIEDSFENSLKNLRTTYIDSYILHSPLETVSRTIAAWRVLMALQDSGKVKFIGVSNTYDVRILEALEDEGGRRVQVVQNRWFEGNDWDAKVFAYCKERDVQYQ